jgi:hypothetical protein
MKNMALAIFMALALTVLGSPSWAATSTVKGQVILDKTEISEGDTINLSLLGLNKDGEVDRFGESRGSTIMAVVNTVKGEIRGGSSRPGDTPGDTNPDGGYFASEVNYVRLNQGVGRVSIYYSCDIAVNKEDTTDTITLYLQERVATSGGGVEIVPIGQPIEKTVAIADACGPNWVPIFPKIKVDGVENPNGEVEIGEKGITIYMIAGDESVKIPVTDENFGRLRRIRAPRDARLDLIQNEIVEYGFTEKLVRGEATFGLTADAEDNKKLITKATIVEKEELAVVGVEQEEDRKQLEEEKLKAGAYQIRITAENEEGDLVKVQTRDWLVVLPKKEVHGLRVRSDRGRITFPDPDIFEKEQCPSEFPKNQICEGTSITVTALDEYGNDTTGTDETTFTVSLTDSAGVASNSALKFEFPNTGKGGIGRGIPVEGLDNVLGNNPDELLKIGTTSLVAEASNPNIPDSEPLAIEVVPDALLVESADRKMEWEPVMIDGNTTSVNGEPLMQLKGTSVVKAANEIWSYNSTRVAGTEFPGFIVRVMDGLGDIYLPDKNKTITYEDLVELPFDERPLTFNPGKLQITSSADEEDEERVFSRMSISTDLGQTDIVEVSFRKANSGYYRISSLDENYPEVLISAWRIVPASVNEVSLDKRWLNLDEDKEASEDDIIWINPNQFGDKQFKTVIPGYAFDMRDIYDNPISNLGEIRAITEHGKAKYVNRYSSYDAYGNPVSPGYPITSLDEQGHVTTHDYINEAGGNIEVVYDKGFTGENKIEFGFTKAGLQGKLLAVFSDVPEATEEKTVDEPSVESHIENTNLPVNSEVAMTVEEKGAGSIFFNEVEEDTLTPNVSELIWHEVNLNALECEDAGGKFKEAQCLLTQAQCRALGDDHLFMKDKNDQKAEAKCQRQEERRIQSGESLEAGNTHHVLVIKAGSIEGQFSLTFSDAGADDRTVQEITTFTVSRQFTKSDDKPPVPEPSDKPDECKAEGNFWDDDSEQCQALPALASPNPDGKNGVLNAEGEMAFTSDAQFTGGVTVGEGSLESTSTLQLTEEGTLTLFLGSIKFDSEDIGKTVDIVVAISYQLNPLWNPSGGQTLWYSRTEDGLPEWDGKPANLEPFKAGHTIEDSTLPIKIFEGTLDSKGLASGIINVYLGYRLEEGQIKFGVLPITLDMY